MGGTEEACLVWTSRQWQTGVRSWIGEQLAQRGIRVSGELEQTHVRLWATAMRVPTTDGTMWFKANEPSRRFEAPLLSLLAAVHPAQVAEPIAIDVSRGWLLTRDAGTRLREYAVGDNQLSCWEELLPQYAELQQELAPLSVELLAMGIPDLGLALLPGLLRRLADDTGVLCDAIEEALTMREHRRLVDGLGEFAALCAELAAVGIPETLQHDDLHDGNLFVRDGSFVFFDWGDACLSHPFHTLVVTLRALAHRLGLEAGSSEILRLRDAYLEPWGDYGSRDQLRAAAELSRRTGTIQRAIAWYRYIEQLPAAYAAEEIPSVPYGIRLYLNDEPYGAWG